LVRAPFKRLKVFGAIAKGDIRCRAPKRIHRQSTSDAKTAAAQIEHELGHTMSLTMPGAPAPAKATQGGNDVAEQLPFGRRLIA
jgi:hypothetical protein